MGEKNPRDMLSKASWSLMEVIKDAATTNITTALRTGQINIDAKEVQKLLTVVSASVEEGYHRGFRSFTKTVEAAVQAAPEALEREAAARAKKK
jgi:hypothetical protein